MSTPDYDQLKNMILELLLSRRPDSSICPSEVVRKLYPEGWREWMDDVREVARQMRKEGVIEITQKGSPLVEDQWQGPIRLRLKKERPLVQTKKKS